MASVSTATTPVAPDTMDCSLVFDLDLIRRYDIKGPRYTSYPTADRFQDDFSIEQYREAALATNEDPIPAPLSLYFHIPFCDTVCYYCACNKVITANKKRAAPYLQRLETEIARQGSLFDRDRVVEQLHWGGGTPTFLSHDQMRQLMAATAEHFTLREDDGGEYSIEIDPRRVNELTIALLREIGFNRISMGVQDFDPAVQRAVNRIQPEDHTLAVLNAARAQGFKSVSMDLIYGLPLQTLESFTRTLDKIIAAAPDRLSVFNYAHLPERFKTQRQINAADLPAPSVKLEILQRTIERLTSAGYTYIGMDHFARPDDELAQAQQGQSLARNFQGYSTHSDCDLVAMGVSAISSMGTCYAQNTRDLDTYYQMIDAGDLAITRGLTLNADDLVRREVINDLICHGRLDVSSFEERCGVRFWEYFAAERKRLLPLCEDSLIDMDDRGLTVLPQGRLLIRNVCMIFDRYLAGSGTPKGFSRVI